MTYELPAALIPRRVMFHPEAVSRSGGMSIAGTEKIVASDAGRWRASLDFPLAREEWILAFRSFLANMQGRAGEVLIGPFDAYGPKDANGKRLSPILNAPIGGHKGDLFLFDLAGLGQDNQTHATLAASAALGATRVSLTLAAGVGGPRPGQYFGIGERLYIVRQSWQATEGGAMEVLFWPRLRAAASSGAIVTLDRPRTLMRFASDAEGELALDYSLFGSASISLVEAV